jgi:hypothetical protein
LLESRATARIGTALAIRMSHEVHQMVRTTAALFLAVQLGLAASANAQAFNSVTLAWDANTEPDIAGYILYWGTASRVYDRSLDVGNVTQHTVEGLLESRTYYFAVRAYNTDGLQSAYSAEVSKAIPANPDRIRGIRSRLFWRHNESGALAVWHMDGNQQLSGSAVVGPVVADLEWRIVGTGDFNRDGYTDLVWHHNTDGWVSIWLMAGDRLLDGRQINPRVADTNWRIAAVGDLNRDGYPDLIWQHRTLNQVSVWTMIGTTMREGHLLTPHTVHDANWKIFGAADMDADGNTDLWWRHQVTGALSGWRMNGSVMVGGFATTPAAVADLQWQVVAVTDFNGDNRADFVWQHTDGQLSTWIMNGTVMTHGKPLIPGVAPAAWRIVGAGK